MKKVLLTTLISAMATTAFAAGTQQESKEQKDVIVQKPKITVTVLDFTTEEPKDLGTTTVSIAEKDQRLCWTAYNLPLEETAEVVEIIKSPKGGHFTSDSAIALSSKDKRVHKLTYPKKKTTDDAKSVQECWHFDETDPLGKYSVTIKVNDVQYPEMTFEVVK